MDNLLKYNGKLISTNNKNILRWNDGYEGDPTISGGIGFDYPYYPYGILQLSGDIYADYIVWGDIFSYNGSEVGSIIRINQYGKLNKNIKKFETDEIIVSNMVNSVIEDFIKGQKLVVVGNFKTYGDVSINRIARININGAIDTSFDVGTGFNGEVTKIIKDNNKYICAGNFTKYNDTSVGYIVRINSNGSIDTSFNCNFNNKVVGIIKDSAGKFITIGCYNECNDVSIGTTIRLLHDGSIDSSFDAGEGITNNGVSIALSTFRVNIFQDNNGKYIFCGYIYGYDDEDDILQGIIRLNNDGSHDTSFVGNGYDYASIEDIIDSGDGNYICVGPFRRWNGVSTNGIVKTTLDGVKDASLNTFWGSTGYGEHEVFAIIKDRNSDFVKYILVGTFFVSYYNFPSNGIIRIFENGIRDNTFNTAVEEELPT